MASMLSTTAVVLAVAQQAPQDGQACRQMTQVVQEKDQFQQT
ncbi:hypothetical protein [Paracoccus bogoriensis]|nr:hypothetical protein [Paracoccus bogoriensis]